MPFGPDCQYPDHAACVADNPDVEDPDAYCADLERETADTCTDDMGLRWQGVIAVEGQPTGDGRMIERGALTWDADPIALIWDRHEGDHTGTVVGRVTRIWRDGDDIMAEGDLSQSDDPETQAAVARVAELLAEGAVGVSVMLDSEDVEIRVSADLLERVEAETEAEADDVVIATAPAAATAEGKAAAWLTGHLRLGPRPAVEVVRAAKAAGHAEKTLRRAKAAMGVESVKTADGWTWQTSDEPERDEDGRVVVAKWRTDDELLVTVSARVRHLAIVDTAAFADARIALAAAADSGWPAGRIALVASLDLDAYDDPRFGVDGDEDPRLARQQPERPGESVAWGAPLTVTDDGRVFGHAALWGRCHAGFADRCTVAPRGGEYGRFLTGSAVPGVATGPITVGTTHAHLAASPGEAMRHYSDTGRAVADVAVGEDDHGIWVAGRVRAGVSDADVAALRGSSLSGDWRWLGGRLRLVGLLAVNQPGFLVEREALAASGGVVLTAGPCNCDDASLPAPFSSATLTLEGDHHEPVTLGFTLERVAADDDDAAVEWAGEWFALRATDEPTDTNEADGEDDEMGLRDEDDFTHTQRHDPGAPLEMTAERFSELETLSAARMRRLGNERRERDAQLDALAERFGVLEERFGVLEELVAGLVADQLDS